MEAWQLWTIIGFLLLIIEIFTPGFVLGSFGLGAFGGGLAAYWGYSLSVQLIVFSIITLAIFFGIRPLYLKYLKRFEADHKTGVQAFIGKQYKVTETISNSEDTGRIKIGGESWRARSETGEVIEAGKMVTVIKIEGATAYVSTNGKGD